MSAKNVPPGDPERLERVSQAIEERVITISDTRTRLRVLSIHPSLTTGESDDEVTLRLVLRPAEASELLIAKNSSLEARLYDFGLTYPFNLRENFEWQVDKLVSTVEEELPRALIQSLGSNKSSVDFSFPVSDSKIVTAALVTAAITVVSMPILIYKGYIPHLASEFFTSLLTFLALLGVLRLIRVKR